MKKLMVLAAFFMSFSAQAEDIVGAFGYKLGDKIDISLGEVKQTEEGLKYINLSTPPNEFELFVVMFAEDTEEIISLIGFSSHQKQECLDEAAAYQKAIEEKYQGKMLRQISIEDFSVELKQGDKYIALSCDYDYMRKESTLTLNYGDNARYHEAKERAAVRNSKQIDSSKL